MIELPHISRRQLLRGAIAAIASGVAAACQPPAPPPNPFAPATPGPTSTPAPATPTAVRVPTPTPTPTRASATPTRGAAALPTFRIAVDLDPDTLDPAGQTHTGTANIVDYMVETLVALEQDGRLRPGLAERWQTSPDGERYTFTLRERVSFHDGAPLDALAVKLSLERVLDARLKVPLRAPFDGDLVESVNVLEAHRVEVRLRRPYPPFLAKLASTEMGIVSPNHARGFPDLYNEQPVGTGPYRFKERRKGESVTLERFDGYWGQKPYYPLVQFRVVPEAATRESLLLAEQVEMLVQPPPSDVPTLQRSQQVRVLLAPSSRTIFVAMDLAYPGGTPLSIKKVRQALNYAVDKEGIIRSVLFGTATPMDAPLAPALFGYTRIGAYPHDPARARQLLLEAGTPQLLLKFLHPTGRSMQEAQAAQVAQAIAGDLREAGVLTELTASDWATFLSAVNVPPGKGTTHMHLFSWAPALLDASQQMVQFSKSSWPPNGLATSHYTNPQVEPLLSQAAAEPDQAKRKALYAEASRLIWDDAPWIFLWVQSFPIVHSAKVKNVGSLPNEKFWTVSAEPAA